MISLDNIEKNQYVDKSHIFLNENTLELYVMFDGYFNTSIDNFKEILYKLKYNSEEKIQHEYFNFEHTLYSDFTDTNEYYERIYSPDCKHEIDYDYDYDYDKNKKCIKNNHCLYECFQFKNEYHIPYYGFSKLDDPRYENKRNNYNYINKYYDFSNHNQLDKTKKLVDKYFSNITKIYFGFEFNKSIDNLHDSINWLILGKQFNKPIHKYPLDLKYLTFGYDFNQCVDNLPSLLERLVFGGEFNKPIDNIPDSITHLSFYIQYYSTIDNYKFGYNNNFDFQPSGGEIHKSCFSKKIIKLPKKLTCLVLDNCKNFLELENVITNSKITVIQANSLTDKFLLNLPDTLEHLILFYSYPKINKLPSGLKSLKMNFANCLELLQCLPNNLKILIIILGDYYNLNSINYQYELTNLPLTLKYLKIIDYQSNNNYNFNYLPSSITHLTLKTNTQNLLNNLPSLITHLWIDDNNNDEFYPQDNIKELYCGKDYIIKNIDKINKNIIIKNIYKHFFI